MRVKCRCQARAHRLLRVLGSGWVARAPALFEGLALGASVLMMTFCERDIAYRSAERAKPCTFTPDWGRPDNSIYGDGVMINSTNKGL